MSKGTSFVHLHNHMEGSFSDSALRVCGALDRVVELGMNAFAITDHGEMAMVRAFAKEAQLRGIKPIVGMEAYFVEDAAENIRRRLNDRFHLTLLAMNKTGYRNLITIASLSWKDNCLMQKLGLVDWKLLEKYSEGIVCLSGCLAGPVAWSFYKDRPDDAARFYGRFSELFGERYYIEVYNHESPEERKATNGLLELAGRHGHRTVLTNDCHYLHPCDWRLHDTLIKTRFGKANDFSLPYHEYFIKSPAEMRGLGFSDETSDMTVEIAERIELTAAEILAPDLSAEGLVETAFIQSRSYLSRTECVEKAAGVKRLVRREQERVAKLSPEECRAEYPEIAEIASGIEGLPVRPEPDFGRVVAGPGLSSRVPLRRSEKALFSMWTEAECREAGFDVRPVEDFPELLPVAHATEAYKKGLDAYKRKHLEKARRHFSAALEFDPDFNNARYQLGLVEYYDDHMDAARSCFEEVLRREPHFERLPHLRSYLGWCLFRQNETDKAISSFRISIGEKEIPGSLLGLGLSLERNGANDEAVAILMRLLEIAPDFPRLQTAQKALMRLGGGNH